MNRYLWIAALCAAVAMPASAQDGSAGAKRVKPPKAGVTKRINVQIAPRDNPAVPPLPSTRRDAPTAAVAASAPAAPTSSCDWYWDHVSPGLAQTGPGRVVPAMAALAKGPGGSTVLGPRLQTLQEIADKHGKDILISTVGTQVSPALALAVIAVESSGRADAVSKAGAQGLMQLMPATAERFGVTDAFDPAQNIKGGVAFLDFLMTKFEGDPVLVLAGYNAGENSIAKNDGVPPYAETRDYVPKVLAAFKTARGLCLTPPELASDGCVLRMASSR